MPAWSCKCFASAKSDRWSKIVRTTDLKFCWHQGWQKHIIGRHVVLLWFPGQISNHIFNTSLSNLGHGVQCQQSLVVWKEWLHYITHVDHMEFACWVIKILVIVSLGFRCQRPLDNQWPDHWLSRFVLQYWDFAYFWDAYMLSKHGTPKRTNPCHAFPPNHGETKQSLAELLEPGLCRLLPVGSGSLLLGNYEATYRRLVVYLSPLVLKPLVHSYILYIKSLQFYCSLLAFLLRMAFGNRESKKSDRDREGERYSTHGIPWCQCLCSNKT